MKLLRFFAITYPRLPAPGQPYPFSDSIPPLYVALVTILMFSIGLVLLVGSLHRWRTIRKGQQNLSGWHRNHRNHRQSRDAASHDVLVWLRDVRTAAAGPRETSQRRPDSGLPLT